MFVHARYLQTTCEISFLRRSPLSLITQIGTAAQCVRISRSQPLAIGSRQVRVRECKKKARRTEKDFCAFPLRSTCCTRRFDQSHVSLRSRRSITVKYRAGRTKERSQSAKLWDFACRSSQRSIRDTCRVPLIWSTKLPILRLLLMARVILTFNRLG